MLGVSADDSGENIRVYVRVRPPNERETESGFRSCVKVDKEARAVIIDTKPDAKTFTYDHVAGADSTQVWMLFEIRTLLQNHSRHPFCGMQEEVFQKVGRPITDACMTGYNATIFAYGQTGSGKTFTIQGELCDVLTALSCTTLTLRTCFRSLGLFRKQI